MFTQWTDTLTKEQIVDYLLEWQAKGFEIVEKRPPIVDGWTIVYSSTIWVGIRPANMDTNLWSVCVGNLGRSMGQVGTMKDLREYIDSAWRNFGVSLDTKPSQKNTYKDKPVSNISALVVMIGEISGIKIIQDDYIENLSLSNLISMKSLGVKFAPELRILTTDKKIIRRTLTPEFIRDFAKEVESKVEVRYQNHDHQRLIVLSDERCISLDFSLNNFSNSGLITQVQKSNEKISSFENNWKKSTQFYI